MSEINLFQGCVRRPCLPHHHHPHQAALWLLAVQVFPRLLIIIRRIILTVSIRIIRIIGIICINTYQAPWKTTLDCLQDALKQLRILRKYSRLQAEFRSSPGKMKKIHLGKWMWNTQNSEYHIWKWKFSQSVKVKVEKKCTLKPLLPDPKSLQQLAMQMLFDVGFKDSTIFCSGSMQLVHF